MTKKQQQQFNIMLATLKRIAKDYQSPDKLRRSSEKQYGLSYQETLEMAYENIQMEAANVVRGVKALKVE